MNRGIWFVAGAGAGIYAMVKARRAAEAFTPEGLRDRMAGLGVGAHLFADEVRAGMTEKETELRELLGLTLDGPPELVSTGSTNERRSTNELRSANERRSTNARLKDTD